MTKTELQFASIALRELYFISNTKKDKIQGWIEENKFNIDEIRDYLNSLNVEKRSAANKLEKNMALELLNREIVAFNFYFPEKMTGSIRHKLTAYRLINGLTQKELAERIGVRNATISDFENGKYNIGSDKLEAIMKELGLSILPE